MVLKDRYVLLERIASGGMGEVWTASDRQLEGRTVAVKMLLGSVEGAERESHRNRLVREIRTLTRLSDPRLVDIRDHGEHDGQPFLVMEYVEGQTVDRVIATGPRLPLEESLTIIETLCDGIHSAHLAGVVHRDIKPANVIIDIRTGALKVVDFGLARTTDTGLSREGTLTGTLNYMSPEQVRGDPKLDHRSDIFAIGAVCYELLSGKRAFPGDLRTGLLHRIANEQPTPLDTVRPDLPRDVVQVVERALQKRPEDRYQTLSEMACDVRRIRDGLAEGRPTAETIALDGPTVLEHRVAMARRCLEDGDLADAARLVASVLEVDATHEGGLEVQRDLRALQRRADWHAEWTRARPAALPAAAVLGLLSVVLAMWVGFSAPSDIADDARGEAPPALDTSATTEQSDEGAGPAVPADAPAPTASAPDDGPRDAATAMAGLLAIDALPWAEVVAVRNSQGETVSEGDATPLALTLPPGSYTVTLRRAGLTRTETVRLDQGGTAATRFEFGPVDVDAYFARSVQP